MKRLLCAAVLALPLVGCSENPESIGARLQRECESIIDTADALSSPIRISNMDIVNVLIKDPKLKPELEDKYDRWEKHRNDHPDMWDAAYREVSQVKQTKYLQDVRPQRIAECVIRRGTAAGEGQVRRSR